MMLASQYPTYIRVFCNVSFLFYFNVPPAIS